MNSGKMVSKHENYKYNVNKKTIIMDVTYGKKSALNPCFSTDQNNFDHDCAKL